MALRKKLHKITEYSPDILIISECEESLTSNSSLLDSYPNNCWIGDNKSKGLGIFMKSHLNFELFEEYNGSFKYILPLKIKDLPNLILFGIWAMDDKKDKRNGYISQVGSALNYYRELLKDKECILIGDFNSNAIWDNFSPKKYYNHTYVTEYLIQNDIKSVYHEINNQSFGNELEPTFYMYRHEDKGYHIDYAFCSDSLLRELIGFSIGDYGEWGTYSDHMPLFIEFNEGVCDISTR